MAAKRSQAHYTVVEAWLVTFPSASTRMAYQRDLALYIEWLASQGVHPFEATAQHFNDYRLHHERAAAGAATIQRRLASVSSFYRFAVARRHITYSPATGPRRPVETAPPPTTSTTETLSVRERSLLWSSATTLGPRSAALVGLLLFDGLKLFETLGLDVGDVSRSARGPRPGGLTVSVRRRGNPVPIPLDSRTALAVHQVRRGRMSGPLFLGESITVGGARLTRFGADYLLKQVGAAAGLRSPLTANRLRSTHISEALKHADLESVRDSVGHVDRRTTLRFLLRGDTQHS